MFNFVSASPMTLYCVNGKICKDTKGDNLADYYKTWQTVLGVTSEVYIDFNNVSESDPFCANP